MCYVLLAWCIIRRMNEVTLRRARLVLGMSDRLWAGIPSRYVTSQLGQLSLAPLRLGKGWNVTSAGWHVSSSSGVATLVSEVL